MTNSTDALSLIHETQVFVKEFIFLMTFIYHVWLCILIFGLVSNTINVLVFGKIGFRDNVTVTLLFLSLSDLLNLILRCPMTVSRFDHDWPFDPDILYLCFYWYAYVFYDYSSFNRCSWRLYDASVLRDLFGLSPCLRHPEPSKYSSYCFS